MSWNDISKTESSNELWECSVPDCENNTDSVALVRIEGYRYSVEQLMCYSHIYYFRYRYRRKYRIEILADEWPKEAKRLARLKNHEVSKLR